MFPGVSVVLTVYRGEVEIQCGPVAVAAVLAPPAAAAEGDDDGGGGYTGKVVADLTHRDIPFAKTQINQLRDHKFLESDFDFVSNVIFVP